MNQICICIKDWAEGNPSLMPYTKGQEYYYTIKTQYQFQERKNITYYVVYQNIVLMDATTMVGGVDMEKQTFDDYFIDKQQNRDEKLTKILSK